MNVATELQAQVDAQLMEQGAFAPLELLLSSGRLIYSDYEAWRRREIEVLDDVLMGDRQKIVAEMERATAYAMSIGLVKQPYELTAWPSASSTSLRASTDPKLHSLIGSRYVPAQNAPQMDLFFDNPVVALTNGIAQALAARNPGDAQKLLDRLYIQAPNHPDLAAFDQLAGALDAISRPIADLAARLELLTILAPTARRLLGSGSRDYLSPLWRHLGDALVGREFVPAEPSLHRSFALIQAQDWAGVSESVLAEPQWWLHAPLCLRLMESAWRRRQRVEALRAWCYLCWVAPEEAAPAVSRQPELSELWRRFLDCEAEALDSGLPDATLTASDFPAWLLLHEPGLARQLSIDLPRGLSPAAEENYRCVHQWIHAHRAHRKEEEMALRKQLQQSHPVLFWMLKRTVAQAER